MTKHTFNWDVAEILKILGYFSLIIAVLYLLYQGIFNADDVKVLFEKVVGGLNG